MVEKLNLLDSLIKNDSIKVGYTAKDWKDAIREACKPLVDKRIINWNYYDAILESTAKHGPYYIIIEGLAMPHASSTENAVLSNGFSLLTLTKPIYFENDERKVQIIMVLAAKDGETHTAVAIPQIRAVFEDPANVEKVANAKNKEEIIKLIKSIDYTKYLS